MAEVSSAQGIPALLPGHGHVAEDCSIAQQHPACTSTGASACQPSVCCMLELGSTPMFSRLLPGHATLRQLLTASKHSATTLTVAEHVIRLTGPHKLCVRCGRGVCIRVAGEGEFAEPAAPVMRCSSLLRSSRPRTGGQGMLTRAAQATCHAAGALKCMPEEL